MCWHRGKLQTLRVVYLYVWISVFLLLFGSMLIKSGWTKTRPRLLTCIAAAVLVVVVPYAMWKISIQAAQADIMAIRGLQWTRGDAAPVLGKKKDIPRLSLAIGIAHLLDATKKAPLIDEYLTETAAKSTMLAEKTPAGESFYKGNVPDIETLRELDPLIMEKLSQTDFFLIAERALYRIFQMNRSDPQNALNIARLHRKWSAAAKDKEARTENQKQAESWYTLARGMILPNPHVENEMAGFYLERQLDIDKAIEHLDLSLKLEDTKLETYKLQTSARMLKFRKECAKVLRDAMNVKKGPDLTIDENCRKILDSTIGMLEKAIELAPNDEDSYTRMVEALLVAGKYDESVHYIEEGFKVSPRSKKLLSQIIFVSRKKRNPVIGYNTIKKLVDENPESPGFRMTFAYYLVAGGRQDDAKTQIQIALGLGAEDVDIHVDAAKLYQAMKDMNQAALSIQKALMLKPEDKGNLMLGAQIFEKSENYDAAAAALQRAGKLTRDNNELARLFKKMADIYTKAGKPNLAKRALAQADKIANIK